MIEEINQANFDEKVIRSNEPVVLKVWGSRCHNCNTMAPIFEATAADSQQQAKFYSLKADDNIELVRRLKIMGVPTLLFYHHGVLLAKKIGVLSQKSITKILAPIIVLSPADAEAGKYRSWWSRLTKKK
jgi:thioredoxin-like negative regulator of GroEL